MKTHWNGKLPQRKITQEAAHGYSSYGNQIGLATGLVDEVYHDNYVAKRMEIGRRCRRSTGRPRDPESSGERRCDRPRRRTHRTRRLRRRNRILKGAYRGIHPPVRRRSPEGQSSGRAKHHSRMFRRKEVAYPHQTLQRLRRRRRIRSHRRTG